MPRNVYTISGFYGSGHTTFNKKHAEQLAAYESSQTGGATLVCGTGKLALETRYFVDGKESTKDEYQQAPEK